MESETTHAAMKAYDKIADKLKLELEYEEMLAVARIIDEEFADIINSLNQVWEDFGKYGELKTSTIMRMKSALAYANGGEAELEKMLSHTKAPETTGEAGKEY